MRFLHTGDWHIGKKLGDFSLKEEQWDVFKKIEKIAFEEQVDAIVIAGDIYDRSLASEESVALFNKMLEKLNIKDKFPLLIISGNHDSATRLSIGGKWMKESGVFIATELDEAFEPVNIGDTQFFLLPFFQPYQARNYFDNPEIRETRDAIPLIVDQMKKKFLPDRHHVLVAHFFASGNKKSAAQTDEKVGGIDMVPLDMLADFDYVALGHIHNPRALKNQHICYSGTPLKFSASEAGQQKGVRIIDLDPFSNRFLPLKSLNEVRVLKGDFSQVISPDSYQEINRQKDYVAVELTDTKPVYDAFNRLEDIYPRLFSLERVGTSMKRANSPAALAAQASQPRRQDPMDILADFYEKETGRKLDSAQSDWAKSILNQVKKEDK